MKRLVVYIWLAALCGLPAEAQKPPEHRNALYVGSATQDRVVREVRHELVTLSSFGIFDNLAFSVSAGAVTLYGQVTRPALRGDAENAVRRIEGVTRVANQIRVLPLSEADDRIRLAAFHAIFGDPALKCYAMQAVPPIHIVVDNGKVTLVGVVLSESDRTLAGTRANAVPGVFSVNNDLKVEH